MSPKEQLSFAIKDTRRQLLDVLEIAYGETSQWAMIRSQVMKLFGRYGLEKFTLSEDWNGTDYDNSNFSR